MPTVQIDMFEGRTLEQKRALVNKVTAAIAETADCSPEAITIIIHEISKDNYAKAGMLFCDK